MKAKYLLILITLIQFNCIRAQVSYNYKLYTTGDGMLTSRSISLFQDSKGYLWISHISGVSKFNGKTFDQIIDKKYGELWQVFDLIENNKKEIIGASKDFVYNLDSKKYIVKDSVFSNYYIEGHKEWGLQKSDIYLDKDSYRIYSLNRSSKAAKDTLFYSKDGIIKYLPMKLGKNTIFNKIIKDKNNNVYVSVTDSIDKTYSYYLFDKGRLNYLIKSKFHANKLERDLKDNIILFSRELGDQEVSIYGRDNKLIKHFTFKPLNEAWRDFNCVVDENNTIWIPSFKGLVKYSKEEGVKEFIDPDRNVDKKVVEEFGPDGTAFIVEHIVDGNYCHLVIDNNGNLINGDRIFNGESFSDLLPFSLYSKFGLNEYRSENKQLTKIYNMLCDRENNIWMVTDEGLIKFTPVPYRNTQYYLSKNDLDFMLKHTDNLGRKFYVKTDDINRFIHVKIYKDTSLLFSKTYKKSPLSSKKGGLQEFLNFYKQGNNTVMYFNSESYKYALCFFDDKELKRYEFANTLNLLYTDSSNIIFQEWQKNLIVLNKDRKLEKKNLPIHFANYYYGYEFLYLFTKDNKFLGRNLLVYQVKPNLELDSFSFGNFPVSSRYNLKKVAKINVQGYDLLVVDKDMNYYLANEKKHLKLDILDKEKLNSVINNSQYYFNVLEFKDLLLFSNGSQLLSYKIDSIHHKLTYHSKFTYENGLMVMSGNEFFVNNDYLISHSTGNPFILLFSYQNFIKNGLNAPVNIKITRSEDFIFSDPKKYLNDNFFNKQPPLINVNEISYSYKGERLVDTSDVHIFSSSISNLTFNFDAVSLTEGDYIQTKYNVLGFDTTWQIIKTNDIVFSSLPPGSYTLQIKACNNHNYWSEPKQFAFTIDFPWYRTWFAYILYAVVGGGAIYLFIKSRTKKLEAEKENLEKIVEERTAEVIEEKKVITEQKHLIEEKHKEITDSINYAERIQRSFLATKEQLDEQLKDYFVLFQPKDVVSGDFYWAHSLQNGNFALVTADSTGHGVPGAIMSLLNTSSLEKAVELGINEPAEILNHTRQTIIQRLKKDGSAEGGKDGMDCSLISFNKDKTKLTYAAANNPIWIVRSNSPFEGGVRRTGDVELIELSPDKIPVGKHDRDSVSFTQHEIELQKGDMIYTLTDGFPDQFGGPKGKKFLYKKLKEFLISIAHKPTIEQQSILKNTLKDWMGNTEQVDDVTIIGVRV